jgi:hypothetical protein
LWTWDSATGHTTNGSAKTTANSTLKALLSNPSKSRKGRQLSPAVWVKGSGYTGSGTPIRLAVRTYLSGAVVGTTNIQSVAGPGGPRGPNSPGRTRFPQVWTLSPSALVVDSTATGGTIWFDDATLSKSR